MPDQQLLDFGPPPAPGFEHFVVGDNAECLATLRRLPDDPAIRSVYLWGPPGCGKTHLAQALSAEAAVRGADWIEIADDCHRLGPEDQERLFHRFNELMARPRGTLAAFGSEPPQRLPILPDLASRLAWGIVLGLKPLNDQGLAAALEATAARRGLILGDDVIGYLLRHARRDMGSLSTIVARLDRLSLQWQRPVTLPLLREVLAVGPDGAQDAADTARPEPRAPIRGPLDDGPAEGLR